MMHGQKNIKLEVKFILEETTKAQRGSRGIVLHVL